MKKEINDLLTLGNADKKLTLNGAFELKARYTGADGANVELTGHEPVEVHLSLVYTLSHDKFLFRHRDIEARDYAGVMEEVAGKMKEMYAEFGEELAKQFTSGYLG